MQQAVEQITNKLHALAPEQLAEVERFVDALEDWESDLKLARLSARLSEPSLQAIWDNPEDDVYNDL